MKILLDHCVPKRLRSLLPTHEVKTTREMNWEQLKNGALLAEASRQFDVLVTVDQNLKHEQNLSTLPVAVAVLVAPSNQLADLTLLVPALEELLKVLAPRTLVEVKCPP